MASAASVSKLPLFRTIASRGYAVQPAVAAARSGEIQNTTLPNKLAVTSTETGSPISRVCIAFRAGARNENYDNQGASHLIRIAAGLSTKYATGFGITRHIQQVGGNLSVVSDREVIAYTIEVTRDELETALQFLQNSATGQIFKPWEISDNLPRVKVDLANVSDQVRAVELLHRAAYRTALGNSLFCPDYNVGKLSPETLQHYYESNFTSNRAAVSGINVDHQVLVGFAQNLQLESGEGAKNECKYHGGVDIRQDKTGRYASVAVGTNGGSWTSAKEGLAFAVLQRAAGIGANTKRGQSAGVLVKAIQSVAPNSAVSSFNACYTDNGLFGFTVSGPAKEVGGAVEAGVKSLKSASINDDDINRGKALLKAEIAYNYDSESTLIHALAEQSAILGAPLTLKSALEAVDAIQASDVKSAARKLSEKVSIGAVGNLGHVPYAADFN